MWVLNASVQWIQNDYTKFGTSGFGCSRWVLTWYFLYQTLTSSCVMSTRHRCASSHLTAASNVALPALSSQWESVAQAQAQRACAVVDLEAQNHPPVTPILTIATPAVLTHLNLDDQPRSNAGSLPITPTTSSIPPSTAPPSESESNSDRVSTTAAKKGKNKWKKRPRNSGEVYQQIFWYIYIDFKFRCRQHCSDQ